jgi:hypothetical protein
MPDRGSRQPTSAQSQDATFHEQHAPPSQGVHNATIRVRGKGRGFVVRRWLPLVFACAFALASAPSASAQEELAPPDYAFEHDSSRDGTADEIHSGFYGGDDLDNSNGDPLQDRYDNTYEYFYFTPNSANYGSFTVNINWGDPRIDFDLYVYRVRPDGEIVPANVASSAAGGTTAENATYTPRNIGDPVERQIPDRGRQLVLARRRRRSDVR